MKYILLGIFIIVVWFFAYYMCQASGENQYPDIHDVYPPREDEE